MLIENLTEGCVASVATEVEINSAARGVSPGVEDGEEGGAATGGVFLFRHALLCAPLVCVPGVQTQVPPLPHWNAP